MASSQQGNPTLPKSVPIAKTIRHLRSNTYQLPRVDVVTEETNHVPPGTPVTPDQRLHGPNRIQGSYNNERSPDRNSALGQSEAPNAATSANLRCRSTLPPASPSRTANVRIRRSQHSSTLLESPACAGHAARMKQIFEDASCGYYTTQDHASALYPQLPNISRKASPPPFHTRSIQREAPGTPPDRPLAPLCLSMKDLPAAPRPELPGPNLSVLSERTSGSWSDDSGYFIADSRGQASAATTLSNDRIIDWLQKVSRVGSHATEDSIADESDGNHEFRPSAPSSINTQTLTTAESYEIDADAQHSDQPLRTRGNDPFISDNSNSSASLLLGLRGDQEPFSLSCYRNIRPTNATDNYKRLNFSRAEALCLHSGADGPALTTPSSTPLPPSQHNPTSTPVKHPAPNVDGTQLSPLSPNVCIERGPSRYHSNCKSLNDNDLTSTPTIAQSRIDEHAPQLKENVSLSEEKSVSLSSPLASRSARAGTRFQRSQYNTLTFNINKQA
ncbi:Nn.00g035400.m01.CDS01 [Neocucurbitaria sp. VM-36]